MRRTADVKTGAGTRLGLVITAAGKGVYYTDDGDNTTPTAPLNGPAPPFRTGREGFIGDSRLWCYGASRLRTQMAGGARTEPRLGPSGDRRAGHSNHTRSRGNAISETPKPRKLARDSHDPSRMVDTPGCA